MYNGKKGLRCRICTGCGLCPGVTPGRAEGIHVLTSEGSGRNGGLFGETFPGEPARVFSGNRRLVTADIGTTTVAMLLYGADGAVADQFMAVNPQRKYGPDVISRIHAAEEPEKAAEMQRRIRQVLTQGLERFRKRLGQDETIFLIIAANTTMNYLLMGRDPSELGRAPFHASYLREEQTELDGMPCFLIPGLSAFVGGDILAGMLACGMDRREEIQLLIDLGTNGELVLGNRERRIACATAAGPAFEGGPAAGVWGADMVSLLAALLREGLVDEAGLLAEPYFEDGVRVGNVLIRQEAVRAVQLAKAAVAAGIQILLDRYEIRPEQVDRVILAGGFGYYLNPADAALIGLLPGEWEKKTVAGGNTALAGAARAGWDLLRAAGRPDGKTGLKSGVSSASAAGRPDGKTGLKSGVSSASAAGRPDGKTGLKSGVSSAPAAGRPDGKTGLKSGVSSAPAAGRPDGKTGPESGVSSAPAAGRPGTEETLELAERLQRLVRGTECLNLAGEKDFSSYYMDRLELKELFFDSVNL